MRLTSEPYELSLTATAAGWAHLTRTAASSDEVLVYALPLEADETSTVSTRPGVDNAPMRSNRGTTITPLRLVGGNTNGCEDVFVHDRQTGITERVSVGLIGLSEVEITQGLAEGDPVLLAATVPLSEGLRVSPAP